MWLEQFYPDECTESVYQIDFAAWYQKGYRGVMFDIDNTLVPHGADATKEAVEFFGKLQKAGWKTCLISNNKEARVKRFNQEIGSLFLFDAHKPSRAGYQKAMKLMGTTPETTLLIGDQLFTDVYGAKRSGIYSILTTPIHKKEEIQIVLKRRLERIVLHFYQKEQQARKRNKAEQRKRQADGETKRKRR